MDILEECYEESKNVLNKCSTPHGLFASGGKEGYDAVWARDSIISLFGAGKEFENVLIKSLATLRSNQSKHGQIPNAVDKFSKRKPHVDFQSIDSSLWYIIGLYSLKKYNKKEFNKHKISMKKALDWISYQDISEKGLPEQLPTTDWQDAFPHKYGKTINTLSLYYHVLNLTGQKRKAEKLKKIVNADKENGLWNGEFYYAYRWKNHNKYKEVSSWFDTLGNILAIVFGLADKNQAEKIISYIEKHKISSPFPSKDLFPPIDQKSKDWHDYFKDCDAIPNNYSNGGIWPFIGSFHVLALIKMKKLGLAKKHLENLAKANLEGNFPEWIHSKTKENYGSLQAWDAGTYILAYDSFKKRQSLSIKNDKNKEESIVNT